MPEQYRLPGIVHGMRWIADGNYASHRLAATEEFEQLGSVVNYLMAEPVQQTYDDFMALGGQLAEVGRFPQRRLSLHLRLLDLVHWTAAPRVQVSDEVVPFRPHRGVLLLVEEPAGDVHSWREWVEQEHLPVLLEQPGIAGAWMYAATDEWSLQPNCEGGPEFVTVVYLDADPPETTDAVAAVVKGRWATGAVRPLYAGPLRTMMQWDVWPA
jgi:hypothetical protein